MFVRCGCGVCGGWSTYLSVSLQGVQGRGGDGTQCGCGLCDR